MSKNIIIGNYYNYKNVCGKLVGFNGYQIIFKVSDNDFRYIDAEKFINDVENCV